VTGGLLGVTIVLGPSSNLGHRRGFCYRTRAYAGAHGNHGKLPFSLFPHRAPASKLWRPIHRTGLLRFFLFFFFIAIPLIEIALFIQVGGYIGVPATIGIVLGTALLGASLLRVQGIQTWQRAEEAMRRGEPPVAEMFDGVFLFAAALLMITPGFFTDCIGITLLIPPLRRRLGRYVAQRIIASGQFQVYPGGMNPGGMNPGSPQGGPAARGPGPVIEGEAEELNDEDAPSRPDRPGSPWRP